MRSYLKKFDALNVGWNRRPLDEQDFYRLCRRHRVTVVEMPLRTNGFYYCVKGKHYIAVNNCLPRIKKLLVMFHEFAHFLMHAPETNTTASFHGLGQKTRKEREADTFALCSLIPKERIERRNITELIDEGFTSDNIEERFAIYQRLRI